MGSAQIPAGAHVILYHMIGAGLAARPAAHCPAGRRLSRGSGPVPKRFGLLTRPLPRSHTASSPCWSVTNASSGKPPCASAFASLRVPLHTVVPSVSERYQTSMIGKACASTQTIACGHKRTDASATPAQASPPRPARPCMHEACDYCCTAHTPADAYQGNAALPLMMHAV